LCLGFEVHLLFLLVACLTQHPLVDEQIVHVHGGTMSVVLDWGLCCFLYGTADLFSICICNCQFNMTGISLPLPACNIFDLSCKNQKHLREPSVPERDRDGKPILSYPTHVMFWTIFHLFSPRQSLSSSSATVHDIDALTTNGKSKAKGTWNCSPCTQEIISNHKQFWFFFKMYVFCHRIDLHFEMTPNRNKNRKAFATAE
jgi:hypothetical protein